jgi:hypothetical protein
MRPVAERRPRWSTRVNGFVFYHDLRRQGGLRPALDTALQQIGSALRVEPMDGPFPVTCEVVSAGDRSSQVYLAARGRLFLFDCWDRHACLAHGSTRSLTRLARAIDRWVGSDCAVAALASEWRFVRPAPLAAVYESGGELEHTWQMLVASARDRLSRAPGEWDGLDLFVVAASTRPALRQLFPVTSSLSSRIGFSRCTRYPFSHDLPSVRGTGDTGLFTYQVCAPGALVPLGSGDADHAADLLV